MKNSAVCILSFVLLLVALQCDAQKRQKKLNVQAQENAERELGVSHSCVEHINSAVFGEDGPSMQGLMKIPSRGMAIASKLMSRPNPCTDWLDKILGYVMQFFTAIGLDGSKLKGMLQMFGLGRK